MKVSPMESGMNLPKTDTSSVVNGDKSMRYGIAVAGMASGEILAIKNTFLRLFLVFYHILIIALLVINFCAAAVIFFTERRNLELSPLFLQISILAWYGDVTITAVISLINCLRKSGFIAYYKQLSKLEESFAVFGINLRRKRIVRAAILATALGWMAASINIGTKLYDYALPETQDPFYDVHFAERLNSNLTYLLLKWLGRVAVLYIGCQWTLVVFQYVLTCFTILTIAADFNKKFEQDVNASPKEAVQNINQYRVAHLLLCDLVSKANDCFSVILAVKISLGVLQLLLIFYLLSIGTSGPNAIDMAGIFAYWVISGGSILVVYIVTAHKVSEMVSSATKIGKKKFKACMPKGNDFINNHTNIRVTCAAQNVCNFQA